MTPADRDKLLVYLNAENISAVTITLNDGRRITGEAGSSEAGNVIGDGPFELLTKEGRSGQRHRIDLANVKAARLKFTNGNEMTFGS